MNMEEAERMNSQDGSSVSSGQHVLSPPYKVPIYVEVCLRPTSTAPEEDIRKAVSRALGKRSFTCMDGPVALNPGEDPWLEAQVDSIRVCDTDMDGKVYLFWQLEFVIQVYQLCEDGAAEEMEENDAIASFQEWTLPTREFHGLWDSLVFDDTGHVGVKQRLLRYANSAILFSDKGVNPRLVAWNRVILLHGPPGTGKTSLCKALSQKLAVRFKHRYPQASLVEVNAHSLFSKWFSESGKLVSRLFAKINELADDEGLMLFLLIDEVESLTAARQSALAGSEPSDAIRVVNALLTHLDQLSMRRNVLVLTSSNITEGIDLAFLDRADLKLYIGPPSVQARYEILRTCLAELLEKGVISGSPETAPLSFEQLASSSGMAAQALGSPIGLLSQSLLSTAQVCEGLSGRALRKLPFLAHTRFQGQGSCDAAAFMEALNTAAKTEIEDRSELRNHLHALTRKVNRHRLE